MGDQELLTVLQDSAYLIKQYTNTCTGVQKELPTRVYGNLLRAINELKPQRSKELIELEKQVLEDGISKDNTKEPIEPTVIKASALLLQSGLFFDAQLRHPNNQRFLKTCDEFIEEYGQKRFNEVLARVKKRTTTTKVNNLYAYFLNSLNQEKKQGVKN